MRLEQLIVFPLFFDKLGNENIEINSFMFWILLAYNNFLTKETEAFVLFQTEIIALASVLEY